MIALTGYIVDLEKHRTYTQCCQCSRMAICVHAENPVGVWLRLRRSGWLQARPGWFTLWLCPLCVTAGEYVFWASDPYEVELVLPQARIAARGQNRGKGRGRKYPSL
jgi:hypothetical protein